MEQSFDLRQIAQIAWRRKWFFLVPAGAFVALAVALILTLPPVYSSKAVVLVEQQEIPEDIVPSLVTDLIDRRFEVLTRQVLVTDNLVRIIERYDLYREEREVMSRTELAEMMRGRIGTRVLSTEVNDPRTGRSGDMTVAFEITFEDGNPESAQRVTNELVSAYLAANLDTRRAVAEQTQNFFDAERAEAERRIAQIEDAFTRFKLENRELLPEESAFQRQQLVSLEQQLRTLANDLRSLREREGFLTTQLALTDEYETSLTAGGAGATPESQLEIVRAELATAQARYSPQHPDVVRLRRELQSLEQVVGVRGGAGALLEQEAILTSNLAALRERYTPEHPDFQRVERQLASVREEIRRAQAGGTSAARGGLARNQAFVQLSAQLNSVQTEIGSVEQQQIELQETITALQERLARAPAVEREFTRLARELEGAIEDRDVLADKAATAQLSGSLETEAVGERLTLIEPPTVPLAPSSPNKKLLLALGLVLAAGSGSVSALLAELLDRSIHSVRDVAQILGDAPLAMVPTIVTKADRRRAWARQGAFAVLLLLVVAVGLAAVNRFVAPLEVLGFQAQDRAESWLTTTFPSRTPGAETEAP